MRLLRLVLSLDLWLTILRLTCVAYLNLLNQSPMNFFELLTYFTLLTSLAPWRLKTFRGREYIFEYEPYDVNVKP